MKRPQMTPRDLIVILLLLLNFWLVYTGHKELDSNITTLASSAAAVCHQESVGLK
jgi:hypothetical protein